MLDSSTLFVIPDGLINQVPCQTQAALYEDPALDIDMDDDSWVLASREEQFARLAAKQAAEANAVAACGGCPLIAECRNWATSMGQDVFGVVGGMTQEERPNHKTVAYITDYTERGPLGQVRDDLIERWVKAGIPNKQIAERLGCNVRTVERRRAGLAAGSVVVFNPEAPAPVKEEAIAAPVDADKVPVLAANPATAAKVSLLTQRVSPETAAVYDALSDGRFHDRSEIIAATLDLVDRATALKTAPKGRTYADEEAQAAVGARKFLLNRIDIAIRRGRIHSVVSDTGRTLICLEADTAATWKARQPA